MKTRLFKYGLIDKKGFVINESTSGVFAKDISKYLKQNPKKAEKYRFN